MILPRQMQWLHAPISARPSLAAVHVGVLSIGGLGGLEICGRWDWQRHAASPRRNTGILWILWSLQKARRCRLCRRADDRVEHWAPNCCDRGGRHDALPAGRSPLSFFLPAPGAADDRGDCVGAHRYHQSYSGGGIIKTIGVVHQFWRIELRAGRGRPRCVLAPLPAARRTVALRGNAALLRAAAWGAITHRILKHPKPLNNSRPRPQAQHPYNLKNFKTSQEF